LTHGSWQRATGGVVDARQHLVEAGVAAQLVEERADPQPEQAAVTFVSPGRRY
jgi:hypothetical protein